MTVKDVFSSPVLFASSSRDKVNPDKFEVSIKHRDSLKIGSSQLSKMGSMGYKHNYFIDPNATQFTYYEKLESLIDKVAKTNHISTIMWSIDANNNVWLEAAVKMGYIPIYGYGKSSMDRDLILFVKEL
jgi:hypothetical protein